MKTRKPQKQRKILYNAPHHMRGKILSSHLSSELKASHSTRSVPVRSGDTVRVLRGDYKGLEGKVLRVDRNNYRIFIEGVTREKADGSSVQVPIHASKVEVQRINLADKWRSKIMERRGAAKEAQPTEVETAGEKETAESARERAVKEVKSKEGE